MNRLKSVIYASVFACVAQVLLSPAHAQRFWGMTQQKCETTLQQKLSDLIKQTKKDIRTTHNAYALDSFDVLSDTLAALKNPDHQIKPATINENNIYFRGRGWMQLFEPPPECKTYIPKRILDLPPK